jgi:cytochrome b561
MPLQGELAMADYMVQETTGFRAVRYRTIVVWIHWITAALVVTQVILGFTFAEFMDRGPARSEVFAWHRTLGAVILLLALLRLAVRLLNPPPPYPSDFPKWERFAAVWSHRLFYVLLIALPLTGLAAVSGRAVDGKVSLLFGLSLPAIPGISEDNGFGDVHVLLVITTLALLVIHIAAALKNQFSSGTSVADRMPPFRARH